MSISVVMPGAAEEELAAEEADAAADSREASRPGTASTRTAQLASLAEQADLRYASINVGASLRRVYSVADWSESAPFADCGTGVCWLLMKRLVALE